MPLPQKRKKRKKTPPKNRKIKKNENTVIFKMSINFGM